jgi:glycosyltransferase involved in cell wall biosynthesis
MGAGTELIFVEGHSKDNTWEEIERVAREYPGRRIKTLRQPGRGKGDAVRAGFAVAEGDLFMILDADLTVPPEEMPKFYEAVASGRTEFANGSRLVYPMEKSAMQFLNMVANKAFGFLFSHILGQPMKDTLCGTKVLRRADYERIAANRGYFGEFDPFGDFDLLFGAAKLSLKIADLPVRYRDRTYGSTNIQRWRHGWLLLRMVLFGARKLKFV